MKGTPSEGVWAILGPGNDKLPTMLTCVQQAVSPEFRSISPKIRAS